MNLVRPYSAARAAIVALLVAGIFITSGVLAPVSGAQPRAFAETASAQPDVTASPAIGARPDRCETNDQPRQACALSVDAVSGPFTFLPPGDQDWYRVELGAPNGLATTITVRPGGELDLLTTITREDGAPLAIVSGPAISTTLSADIAGIILLRVENRDPGDPSGQTYNIEVRRTLPPPAPPAPASEVAPDALENNWSPATAAPIGVGVIYDLNFVCPVTWGCVGGDHDYFKLPVKQGLQYLICTFDLSPGVDTTLDLFWSNLDTPIASNDDARPNTSFLSVLRWVAPADGVALLRVAPRAGGLLPTVSDTHAGSYRLAVALAGSGLARQLNARIVEQSNQPAATPAPSSAGAASSSQAGAANVPSGQTTRGPALVVARETAFRIAPNPGASLIETLPAETIVTLSGQYSGLWVSVTTAESVLPGWVLGTDLRRADAGQPAATPASLTAPTALPLTMTATPAAAVERQPIVRLIAPIAPEPAPAPLPRQALTVSVTISLAPTLLEPTPSSAARTAIPAPHVSLAGMRVQLVNAFGDLLAEGISGADGQIALTRELSASAVFVRLPAAGIEIPIDPRRPFVSIELPGGAQ